MPNSPIITPVNFEHFLKPRIFATKTRPELRNTGCTKQQGLSHEEPIPPNK